MSDFSLKMHQIRNFGWGSAPDRAGGTNSKGKARGIEWVEEGRENGGR